MRLTSLLAWALGLAVIVSSVSVWALMYATSADRLRNMAAGSAAALQGALAQAELLLRPNGTAARNCTLPATAALSGLPCQPPNLTQALLAAVGQLQGDTANLRAAALAVLRGANNATAAQSAQYRAQTLRVVQAGLAALLQDKVAAVQRIAGLYEAGALNATSPLALDPQDPQHCPWLAAVCSAAGAMQAAGTVSAAPGACSVYRCSRDGNASLVANATVFTWAPSAFVPPSASSPRQPFLQRCVAPEPLSARPVGVACPPATQGGSGCLPDPLCFPSCSQPANASCSLRAVVGSVDRDPLTLTPVLTVSYPLCGLDPSPTPSPSPSRRLGVTAAQVPLAEVARLASSAAAPSNHTLIAIVVPDTNLTVLGTSIACDAPTPPAALPSLLASCSPALQDLGRWMATHTTLLTTSQSVLLAGITWDLQPVTLAADLVGLIAVCVDDTVDAEGGSAAESRLTTALAEFATMQDQHVAQLMQAGLAADQHSRPDVAAQLQRLLDISLQGLAGLERYQSTQLATSAALTLALVLGLLLVAVGGGLCAAARATRRVRELVAALDRMAQLDLDTLEPPEDNSRVAELQQLQDALYVLVDRLAHYKSFIPSAILLPELEPPTTPAPPAAPAGNPGVCSPSAVPFAMARTSTEVLSQDDNGGVSRLKRMMSRRVSMPNPEGSGGGSGESGVSKFKQMIGRRLSIPGVPADVSSGGSGGVTKLKRAMTRGLSMRRTDTQFAGSLLPQVLLQKKFIAVLAVNIVGFKAKLLQLPDSHLEVMMNQYLSIIHSVISKVRGNIDTVVGDQVLVTFNAHVLCSDPTSVAATAALDIVAETKSQAFNKVHAQVGLAAGQVVAGNVGYGPYKTLVTFGVPMKVASLLARLRDFPDPVILADPNVEERIKYSFLLRPVDVVHLPHLGQYCPLHARGLSVHLVEGRKLLAEDEWIYQLDHNAPVSDWETAFRTIAMAEDKATMTRTLQQYLSDNADDAIALRLKSRVSRWLPRLGVRLCEGAEHLPDEAAAPAAAAGAAPRPAFTLTPSFELESCAPATPTTGHTARETSGRRFSSAPHAPPAAPLMPLRVNFRAVSISTK